MKTVRVILPINNPEMLSECDLQPYQSENCFFELSYIDTHLKQLTKPEDAAHVIPLVTKRALEASDNGASAIVVYAFGDLAIKESRDAIKIPIMGLGRAAMHMASILCQRNFTVIPGQLDHNDFIQTLIKENNLQEKFICASHSVEMDPMEMKGNPLLLERLINVANIEIEKGVDTFTLGCGGFINIAKQLQNALRKKHGNQAITVVDPIEVSLRIAAAL